MITRRRFVGALASLAAVGCDDPEASPTEAPPPAAPTAPRGALRDVDSVYRAILAARPAELDGLVTRALRDGASGPLLLEAALRSTLLTRFDGADIHSMASVTAARRVHDDAADGLERVSPLFFSVHFNHAWSQREPVAQRPPSDARALAPSIEAEDYAAADAAMAATVEARGVEAATRIGRRLGARPRGDLHGVIWTAHSERLAAVATEHRPLLLRSLARYLARSPAVGPPIEPLSLDSTDATSGEEIARALRAAPTAELDGLSPTGLFGALAVQCVEHRLQAPFNGGAPLHHSTGFEAYWTVYEAAPIEDRPLVVSQAVHRLRAATPSRLDCLAMSEGPGDPFALAPTDTEAAYRAALRACASDAGAFMGQVRARVARYGGGAHDYKLFGSLLDVAARLPTDELRARWLASAVTMDVMRAETPAPHYAAALAASRA